MKRVLFSIAIAAAFLIGYAGPSLAWPGVPDRNSYHGYFQDVYDDDGADIFAGGIPGYVDSADELIGFVEGQLGGGYRNQAGAAFIIQTMRGGAYSRNNPPTPSELATWEASVRYADTNGLINWHYYGYPFRLNSFWQGANGGSNPDDDAFYDEGFFLYEDSIVFYPSSGANETYALKRSCANPVGRFLNGMTGLPLPEDWNILGDTLVSNPTPAPGEPITWRQNIGNSGTTPSPSISGFSLDGPGATAPTGLSVPFQVFPGGGFAPGETRTVLTDAFTVPAGAAPGTKYCRRLAWDPVSSAGAHDGRSVESCATVVIPAKLKAGMSANPPTAAPGETVTFTPGVSSTSAGSPVNGVTCSIVRTVYSPSGAVVSTGSQPCQTTGGSTSFTIGTGASVVLAANAYAIGAGVPPGTKVCDVMTITNPTFSAYFASPADKTASACAVVAKSPYVHFLGGDVWSGGGFASVAPGTCVNAGKITTVTRSTVVSDGTRPGSGVAYGAFALGKVTNFGSASMALVTTTGVGDAMTFANISPSNLGSFGSPQHCINDYITTYASAPVVAAGAIDVNGGTNGAWRVNGDATFHGDMTPGAQKVYYVTGNVTIDADIKNPTTYAGASQIPSLVIITNGDVYVRSNVAQVDADFIAHGTFYTCHPKVEPATISICSTKLVVNGSVSAGALDLFRTGGADGLTPALQKAPAETFNLSPEVFIKNALNQTTQPTITTSNTRELPPRF